MGGGLGVWPALALVIAAGSLCGLLTASS